MALAVSCNFTVSIDWGYRARQAMGRVACCARCCRYFALAFAASHSAFDMETHPWPLQLFMPLQLFFDDLHSEVPLQELTPEQCIVAVSAATETPASPDVKNIAAVAAIAAFDNLVICIMYPSLAQPQRYCCSCIKTAPGSILLRLPAIY
jgi:hypothetical protein